MLPENPEMKNMLHTIRNGKGGVKEITRNMCVIIALPLRSKLSIP